MNTKEGDRECKLEQDQSFFAKNDVSQMVEGTLHGGKGMLNEGNTWEKSKKLGVENILDIYKLAQWFCRE